MVNIGNFSFVSSSNKNSGGSKKNNSDADEKKSKLSNAKNEKNVNNKVKINLENKKSSGEKAVNKYKRKKLPKNSSQKFMKPYIKQNIEREYKLFFQKKHDSYKAIITENAQRYKKFIKKNICPSQQKK